jgi:hypothetical protein
MISTLQSIVLALQSKQPTTPQSLQRLRKKPRPKTPYHNQQNSDGEDSHHEEELHQLHAITTLQNSSIEQISFIERNTMEESISEEDFPSWDDSSSESETDPNSTSIQSKPQEPDCNNGDLGNSYPGQDT